MVLPHEPQVGDFEAETIATVGRSRAADGARRALSVPAGSGTRRGPERDGAVLSSFKSSGAARLGAVGRPPASVRGRGVARGD